MNKKIDWNRIYSPPKKVLGGEYSSGRDLLQKALEREEEQKKVHQNFQKALPAMNALLKCRLEEKTPLMVIRELRYQASDMVHQRAWNPATGENDGEVTHSSFTDVIKSVKPGTRLLLKAVDNTMQEFIFSDQNGEELIIPFSAKQQLMTQTNIYESVVAFLNKLESGSEK